MRVGSKVYLQVVGQPVSKVTSDVALASTLLNQARGKQVFKSPVHAKQGLIGAFSDGEAKSQLFWEQRYHLCQQPTIISLKDHEGESKVSIQMWKAAAMDSNCHRERRKWTLILIEAINSLIQLETIRKEGDLKTLLSYVIRLITAVNGWLPVSTETI